MFRQGGAWGILVVMTASDAFFVKRAKGAELGRIHHNDHFSVLSMSQQYVPWQKVAP